MLIIHLYGVVCVTFTLAPGGFMSSSTIFQEGSSIAFLGNYLPRRCGIATFTHDLCEAVALQCENMHDVFTIAMNDQTQQFDYPDRVRFEIRQNSQKDYRLAADYLNMNQVSLVCIQHEYGIYGGTCGSHLLSLMRRLRRPVVSTFHTVLKDPTEQQKLILKEVSRISDRIVVMADLAKEFLTDIYKVPAEKIAMIPHGIPDVPFVDPHYFKDQFGIEGRRAMLTFGLLGPGKGLEHVIEAMPAVVAKHPDLVYIILGATHPHVKADSGEEYRNSLIRRVHKLGLEDNVIFVNRFVELSELCEYLGAAELYVTPYLNEAQITSGTLAYAMGTGKAVISTPYWHAQEMLADDRGSLVPFSDPHAMSAAILKYLDDPNLLTSTRKNSYTYCRQMTWNRVAQDYLDLYQEATEAWIEERRVQTATGPKPRRKERFDLPDVDLRHMHILTDDTGIFQHCRFATPDRRHGYCTDDNARALIVAGLHYKINKDPQVIPLMQTYISFLEYAFDESTGRFRNFMNYARNWVEKVGSEDSHCRAIWGLGDAIFNCPYDSIIPLASKIFLQALPAADSFEHPRSWAFALCGIEAYLEKFGGDSEVKRYRASLAEKLLNAFQKNMTKDWLWFEDYVTYANAKPAHVLISAGRAMNRPDMIRLGLDVLSWLVELQTSETGCFSPIGSSDWYKKGGKKARFDQQCIEAHAMVGACIEAYHTTRDQRWVEYAKRAFYWFLGENDVSTPLYDFTTGGCRDGLHSDSVNQNQGAESTLAFLMSLLQMQELQVELSIEEIPINNNVIDNACIINPQQNVEDQYASESAVPQSEQPETNRR